MCVGGDLCVWGREVPEWRPPFPVATAAVATHPTRMHSCSVEIFVRV